MVSRKDANAARVKKHKRVRGKISGTAERPRLCVYRSARHISAQVIDDVNGVTLCVLTLPETDGRAVTAAVSEYIANKGRAVLLCAGERLTFARSADVKADMNELIRRVARGGGRPDMASGAGIPECVSVAKIILMTEGIG